MSLCKGEAIFQPPPPPPHQPTTREVCSTNMNGFRWLPATGGSGKAGDNNGIHIAEGATRTHTHTHRSLMRIELGLPSRRAKRFTHTDAGAGGSMEAKRESPPWCSEGNYSNLRVVTGRGVSPRGIPWNAAPRSPFIVTYVPGTQEGRMPTLGGKKAGSAVRPRIFMAGINDGDKAASIAGGEDVLFLFLPSNRWRSRSLGTKC